MNRVQAGEWEARLLVGDGEKGLSMDDWGGGRLGRRGQGRRGTSSGAQRPKSKLGASLAAPVLGPVALVFPVGNGQREGLLPLQGTSPNLSQSPPPPFPPPLPPPEQPTV